LFYSCNKSDENDSLSLATGIVLDYDSRVPIAGAKVYLWKHNGPRGDMFYNKDSAISELNGRVSFTFSSTDSNLYLIPTKIGYLPPTILSGYPSATKDVVNEMFLARESYLQLTIHQQNIYTNTDLLYLTIYSYPAGPGPFFSTKPIALQRHEVVRQANTVDTTFTFHLVHHKPPFEKIKFDWQIIRSGTILTQGQDSTSLIQFGTKAYSINY